MANRLNNIIISFKNPKNLFIKKWGFIVLVILTFSIIYLLSDKNAIDRCLIGLLFQKDLDQCKFLGKTPWDYLDIVANIAIPLLIIYLTHLWEKREKKKEQQKELDRDKAEKEKELDRDKAEKEQVVQNYIDRISILLITNTNELNEWQENTPVRNIARVLTTTILRRLQEDNEYQNRIIFFLHDTKLKSHILIHCNLIYCDLSKVNFLGTNLSKAELYRAKFIGADLIGANLSGADLRKADLSGADLSGADLSGANLSGADLSGAKLIGANLIGADLSGADLSGADLIRSDPIKADLSGAKLIGADLSGADLSGAKLIGADLSGANLSFANLSEADFSEADLSGANLYRADLFGADLFGADLSGANLYEFKMLTLQQIKLACFWNEAIYTDTIFDDQKGEWIAKNKQANQDQIKGIKNDKASDPKEPPDCRKWK